MQSNASYFESSFETYEEEHFDSNGIRRQRRSGTIEKQAGLNIQQAPPTTPTTPTWLQKLNQLAALLAPFQEHIVALVLLVFKGSEQ